MDPERLAYCAVSFFTSCHMSLNLSIDNAQMGLAQADGDDGLAACDALKIEVIPTIQFWKNKQLLWEHRGVTALDQDLSEGTPTCLMQALAVSNSKLVPMLITIGQHQRVGVYARGQASNLICFVGVLYYADHAANGVKASQYITDIHNKQDLDKFIDQQDSKILTVVDVSLRNAGPCIHIFPAVLALAKNFTGYAHFARLIGDESEATQQVLKELNVNEVSLHMTSRDIVTAFCLRWTALSTRL